MSKRRFYWTLRNRWAKFIDSGLTKKFRIYWGLDDWIAIFFLLIGIIYFWFDTPENLLYRFFRIYQSIHSEMIGIGVTVLILGNTNHALRRKEEKNRLILQMGSPDNGFALEAARQLLSRGWLEDGSIRGICLKGANLEGADLMGADLRDANLNEANLMDASMSGSNLQKADMLRVNLIRAHLKDANMMGTRLKEADLTEANLVHSDLSDGYLNGANLRRANLECAMLSKPYDKPASYKQRFFWYSADGKFDGSKCFCANLQEVDLECANLQDAYLLGVNLNGAKLHGTNLQNTFLCNADLRNISMDEETKWINAIYNDETMWPDCFDPKEVGAIFVKDIEEANKQFFRIRLTSVYKKNYWGCQ
jgi:uncharacterized protein YjbI with pentapeptide repeats